MGEVYNLNWNEFGAHLSKILDQLYLNQEFADVTLFCEGKKLLCHKLILSSGSSYFREIFKEVNCEKSVILLKGIKHNVLQNILQFMYTGHISIEMEKLEEFMDTAQHLMVKGLIDQSCNNVSEQLCDANSSFNVYQENPSTDSKISTSENPYRENHENSSIDSKTSISESSQDYSLSEFVEIKEGAGCSEEEDDKKTKKENISANTPRKYNSNSRKQNIVLNSEFVCKECGKSYSLRTSLNKHMKMHEGMTKCVVCKKVFSRKTDLNRHIKRRHLAPFMYDGENKISLENISSKMVNLKSFDLHQI